MGVDSMEFGAVTDKKTLGAAKQKAGTIVLYKKTGGEKETVYSGDKSVEDIAEDIKSWVKKNELPVSVGCTRRRRWWWWCCL